MSKKACPCILFVGGLLSVERQSCLKCGLKFLWVDIDSNYMTCLSVNFTQQLARRGNKGSSCSCENHSDHLFALKYLQVAWYHLPYSRH